MLNLNPLSTAPRRTVPTTIDANRAQTAQVAPVAQTAPMPPMNGLTQVSQWALGGAKTALAASARVGDDLPAGLRRATEQNFARLSGAANSLKVIGGTFRAAQVVTSETPVRDAVQWGAGELVGGVAETATAASLARTTGGALGARAAAGGFIAGQLVTSAVENIIEGFTDTDPTRWQGKDSLNDMLRTNARENRTALREALSSRNPFRIAGGLFSATYRAIGADLKAVACWFRGRP